MKRRFTDEQAFRPFRKAESLAAQHTALVALPSSLWQRHSLMRSGCPMLEQRALALKLDSLCSRGPLLAQHYRTELDTVKRKGIA